MVICHDWWCLNNLNITKSWDCVCIYIYIYTNSSVQARCDTRSMLKWSLIGLNSKLSFYKTGSHSKVKEPSLPYNLPITGGGRIVECIPFPRVNVNNLGQDLNLGHHVHFQLYHQYLYHIYIYMCERERERERERENLLFLGGVTCNIIVFEPLNL